MDDAELSALQRLQLIRVAVLIVVRDLLVPGAGVFLAVDLMVSGRMEPWHLPLIAGMLGTPLVGRGGKPPPPPPDPRPDDPAG